MSNGSTSPGYSSPKKEMCFPYAAIWKIWSCQASYSSLSKAWDQNSFSDTYISLHSFIYQIIQINLFIFSFKYRLLRLIYFIYSFIHLLIQSFIWIFFDLSIYWLIFNFPLKPWEWFFFSPNKENEDVCSSAYLTLMLLVANYKMITKIIKIQKMTETLANGYSSERI